MLQVTGGQFKGRRLIKPQKARPTLSKVRQSVFNMLQSITSFEDRSFLDLFAGSGIMGIEAISRGFREVYAVDNEIKILKENYKTLGLEQKIIKSDVISFLKKQKGQFDIIYIDAPYEIENYSEMVDLIVKNNLLKEILIIEHNPRNVLNFEGMKILKTKTYGSCALSLLELL